MTDIAQLTPDQIAWLQELETSLQREFDTAVLRNLVRQAAMGQMLQANVYRHMLKLERMKDEVG